MKKLLLAAVLALAPAAALAQAAPAAPAATAPASPAPPAAPLPDADPALWVVRDADTTIYLFGTFHLLDGRPWFNDEVRTAFNASNELVMEAVLPVDVASLAPMVMRYAISDGRTLSRRLNPEQNAALARVVIAMGAQPTAFDVYDPWFVSTTLALLAAQRLGIQASNGPETILTAAARARAMPMGELEGLERQFRMLDSLPEPVQIAQLTEALEQNDELDEKLAPMLAAWSTGDVERLAALIDEGSDEHPALHRILFTERNAAWASWIQERLARPGTIFLAVGAGHLAGNDGVQAVLRARGLDARRVPHVEGN